MKFTGLTFKTQLAFLASVFLPLMLLLTLGVDHYKLKQRNLYRAKMEQHKSAAHRLEEIYQSYLLRLRALVLNFYKKAPLSALEGTEKSSLWVNSARGTFGKLRASPEKLTRFRMAYSKIYLAHRRLINLALFPKTEPVDDLKTPVRIQIYAIENSYSDPNYSRRNYQPSSLYFPSKTMQEILPGGAIDFKDEDDLRDILEKFGLYQWYEAPRSHPVIYSNSQITNEIWDEIIPAFWPVFRVLVFGKRLGTGISGLGNQVLTENIVDLRGKFYPLRFLDRSLELFWNIIPPDFKIEEFENFSKQPGLQTPHGILVALIDSKAAQEHFLDFIQKKPDVPYLKEIQIAVEEWTAQLIKDDITWSLVSDESKIKPSFGISDPVLTSIIKPSFKSDSFYEMRSSSKPLHLELRNLFASMVLGAMMILLISIYLARLLSDRIVNPVLSINQLVTRLKNGETALVIDSSFNLELAMLAIEFQKAASRIRSKIDVLNFLQDMHSELVRTDSKQVLPVMLRDLISRLKGQWGCLGIFDSKISQRTSDYQIHGCDEEQISDLIKKFEEISKNSVNSIYLEFINPVESIHESSPSGLLCYAPKAFDDENQKQILLFIAGAIRDEDQSLIYGLVNQVQMIASRRFLEDIRLDSQIAREIQLNSIDIERPAADSGIDLDFHVSSPEGLGNCFVAWIKIKANHWRFIVGECKVSGISGALVAAMLRARIRSSSALESLDQILSSVHDLLQEFNLDQSTLSFAILELDIDTRLINYTIDQNCFFQHDLISPVDPQTMTKVSQKRDHNLPGFTIYSGSFDKGSRFTLGTRGIFQAMSVKPSENAMEPIKKFEKQHSQLSSKAWIKQFEQELGKFQKDPSLLIEQAILRIRLNQ